PSRGYRPGPVSGQGGSRTSLGHFSMTARTSRAERTRYSSPPYFTSVPPYFEYRTVSPTLTSIGIRLPLSSTRPGPTARTVPSCGFSLAVSGITMPDAVVVSASIAWTTMRSSSGLIATFVAVVTDIPSRVSGWRYLSPVGPVVAGAGTAGLSTLDRRVLTAG